MFVEYLIQAFLIFLELIKYVIIVEIVLSWLILFGIQVRIGFIEGVTAPIYAFIKRVLPTTIGPLDFAPIIAMISLEVIRAVIVVLSAGLIPS